MLLNEIFNTKPIIKWTTVDGNKHRGVFTLGALTYIIKGDEWEISLPNLLLDFLDIGFTAGENEQTQSLEPTKENKASSVLGAVLNSVSPLIKRLNPTAILFSAQKSDPLFQHRIAVYERLADFYMKGGYLHKIKGIESSKASFILLSKVKVNEEQLNTIKEFITTHIEPNK